MGEIAKSHSQTSIPSFAWEEPGNKAKKFPPFCLPSHLSINLIPKLLKLGRGPGRTRMC